MSNFSSVAITATQSYASLATQSQSLQPFANLNLTETQRGSLRSIFANAKKTGESQADVQKQINAVLTPAQQQTLASDLKAGPGGGGPGSSGSGSGSQQAGSPFANLNLTTAQSSSIASILANAQQTGESQADVQKKIDAVLTTAQKTTLAADLKADAASQTTADSATSTSSASASTSSTSTGSTSAAVTSVQNQAAAARSARLNALLQRVLDPEGSTTSS